MSESIIHILSGDLWGGSETQLLLQLSALRQLNCNVYAILFNDGEVARRFSLAKIPFRIIPESNGGLYLWRELSTAISELKPSLIVTHGYKETILGGIIAHRAGLPLVVMYHGITENYTGLKGIKVNAYLQAERIVASKYAAHFIAVSPVVEQHYKRSRSQSFSVVHNVAAPKNIETKTLGELRGDPRIAIVARLVPVKRIDRAIATFRHFRERAPGAELYIIGDGPMMNTLKSNAGDEPSIHFVGFSTLSREYIKGSDVLLLTSDSEGLPTVILEAILEGVPVVTTDLPGIREVKERFPHYPMILCEPNAAALSAGLTEALSAPKPTEEELRGVSQFFSPKRAAHQHIAVYNSVLGKKSL